MVRARGAKGCDAPRAPVLGALQPQTDPEALPALIAGIGDTGDMVICLGAGNITAWANDLPAALDRILGANDTKRGAAP